MIYKEMPLSWKRTFITLWVGCFITGLGFSMTMPFMPLFMESIGSFSRTELNFYSGLAFSATFLAQAIVSPYWGNLADRKGRKLMCLRASGVMTFTILFTGMANSVWMIIGLRFLQGAFSGYVNNATAFMAGEAPEGHSGAVISQMMTASVTGNLIGPMVGGAIAGVLGYRAPFYIVGCLMASVFLLTLTTQEHFTPISAKEMKPMKEIFAGLSNRKLIYTMFITTLLVQSSLMSISPIISLLVKQLMHNQGNVSFVSGVVAAMPGFGTLLVAARLGTKMDEVGPLKILLVGLSLAFVFFIPMYFAHTPMLLGFWRFLLGMASAAMLPAVQTVLTKSVPHEAFGRIFSWNQSFQAAGGMFGPMLGSAIASVFSYQSVFLFTASFVLFDLFLVLAARKEA